MVKKQKTKKESPGDLTYPIHIVYLLIEIDNKEFHRLYLTIDLKTKGIGFLSW